jgi:hypothetical protein
MSPGYPLFVAPTLILSLVATWFPTNLPTIAVSWTRPLVEVPLANPSLGDII